MYEWSRVIFAKKSKFHDAGGPDTVVSPINLSPGTPGWVWVRRRGKISGARPSVSSTWAEWSTWRLQRTWLWTSSTMWTEMCLWRMLCCSVRERPRPCSTWKRGIIKFFDWWLLSFTCFQFNQTIEKWWNYLMECCNLWHLDFLTVAVKNIRSRSLILDPLLHFSNSSKYCWMKGGSTDCPLNIFVPVTMTGESNHSVPDGENTR